MSSRQRVTPKAKPTVDLDFDAIQVASGEVKGKPRKVRIRGQVFTFPAKVPHFAGIAYSEGHARQMWELILGDQVEKFAALGLDLDEVNLLFTELYGTSLGESKASDDS